MKKKIVSMLLVAAMVASMAVGCGSKNDSGSSDTKSDKGESITFMAPDWAIPSDDQLDEFTKEKLHEDLLRIWRATNKTVLFVTHNIEEAVFLSDRVCVLSPHPGRLSAVVDIDLPRPRTLEMKETEHFLELVGKVRKSFEGGSF